jgi:hypothetical protein
LSSHWQRINTGSALTLAHRCVVHRHKWDVLRRPELHRCCCRIGSGQGISDVDLGQRIVSSTRTRTPKIPAAEPPAFRRCLWVNHLSLRHRDHDKSWFTVYAPIENPASVKTLTFRIGDYPGFENRYAYGGISPTRCPGEGLFHRRVTRTERPNTLRGRQSHPISLVDGRTLNGYVSSLSSSDRLS